MGSSTPNRLSPNEWCVMDFLDSLKNDLDKYERMYDKDSWN